MGGVRVNLVANLLSDSGSQLIGHMAYGVSGLVNFWLQVLVIMHISLEIHLEIITRVVKTLPCVAAYMSSLSIIAIAIDR